jgi:hypothetical protein
MRRHEAPSLENERGLRPAEASPSRLLSSRPLLEIQGTRVGRSENRKNPSRCAQDALQFPGFKQARRIAKFDIRWSLPGIRRWSNAVGVTRRFRVNPTIESMRRIIQIAYIASDNRNDPLAVCSSVPRRHDIAKSRSYSACGPIQNHTKPSGPSAARARYPAPVRTDHSRPTRLKCSDGCRGFVRNRA